MSIYTTLTTQLKTVTSLPPFVEQNAVTRSGNTAWARATLLPAEPRPGSIGAGGFDWENGLYIVDLFTPLNSPVDETIAADIITAFPRSLRLVVDTYSNLLEVQRCWVSTTRQDQSWFITSVSVRWLLARNLGV
jgi:hypothetical protein